MEKKYELMKDDVLEIGEGYYAIVLYRIKALKDFNDVKKGDLGGYIEKEDNLSHEGTAWVYDGAIVSGSAEVSEDAQIHGGAEISGRVRVYGNTYALSQKQWNTIYQKEMDKVREWMTANQQEALYQLNKTIFKEDWDKYALGNYSAWEMEALCFYYHEHELKDVNKKLYGIKNFFDLSEEPEIEKYYRRGGADIPLYRLHRICGTCIAKNKTKGSVSLLTPDGVVNVKFRNEYFNLFDKQISARGNDGVKHVIERSWFNRGSMIMVTGIRRGDDFIAKKYASTPGHQLYKIEQVLQDGALKLKTERATGEAEDDE